MIPNEAEFLAALRKVIAAFDALGIQYALGGSFASSLYGEARATRDVLGVLKVQAEALDRTYLRDWAARLNLTDLLRRALDDAGLPPEP